MIDVKLVQRNLLYQLIKILIYLHQIFIHYIEIKTNDFPVRTTTLKRIPIRQDSIIIYWSLPFHIIFIETYQ